MLIILLLGTVYTYLAEGIGRRQQGGTFRALARGYTHWASGRMDKLEINTKTPGYCHVRCCMQPSMKAGNYQVYILLNADDGSASCVQLSVNVLLGMLHNK